MLDLLVEQTFSLLSCQPHPQDVKAAGADSEKRQARTGDHVTKFLNLLRKPVMQNKALRIENSHMKSRITKESL